MSTARLAQRPASDQFSKSIQYWNTWTPTWGNLTVGNGVVTAKYAQVGGTVLWRLSFVLGSTSAVGTNPTFTLPSTAVVEGANGETGIFLATYAHPSAGSYFFGVALVDTTGSVVVFARFNEAQTGITATTPFTWAAGDIMRTQGFYEVAQ